MHISRLARSALQTRPFNFIRARPYSIVSTLKNELNHEELKEKPVLDWSVEEKGVTLTFTKKHGPENLKLIMSNPQEFNLIVEKKDKVIEFELGLDEELVIDAVTVGKSDELKYSPVIDDLDETLVNDLYDYVQERLHLDPILSYYEYKEQKDYIDWLQGLKDFTE